MKQKVKEWTQKRKPQHHIIDQRQLDFENQLSMVVEESFLYSVITTSLVVMMIMTLLKLPEYET